MCIMEIIICIPLLILGFVIAKEHMWRIPCAWCERQKPTMYGRIIHWCANNVSFKVTHGICAAHRQAMEDSIK